MDPDVDIRLLQNGQISSIIPLLLQLNPALEPAVLSQRLREMVAQGYCCAGVFEADVLVGICGFRIVTTYYVGKGAKALANTAWGGSAPMAKPKAVWLTSSIVT